MCKWMMIMVLGVVACGPEDETPVDDGEPQQPVDAEIKAEFVEHRLAIDPIRPNLVRDESIFKVSLDYNKNEPYFLRKESWVILSSDKPITGKEIVSPTKCESQETILVEKNDFITINITCILIQDPFEGDIVIGYFTQNGITYSDPVYVNVQSTLEEN